jgi:diguanylate cyclase (GGDEF)-like protein
MHATGKPVWVQARATLIRDEQGQPLHVLAQVQDISERRRYEERLRHMVDHDPLTGLLNRRGFEVALNTHLAHVRRYGAAGALLVLDLDGFKFINDTLGHAVGDQLIITCARALSSRLRESDVVARLGGDEFAVLLPTGTEDEAKTVAQAAIETVAARSEALSGAHVGRVTASVGIAPFRAGALTADEMLVNADLAMYDAKEAGKARYSVFGAGGHAMPRIKSHMSWLERIRRALAEDRYRLYVQPVIELSSGRMVEYEVLVRMVGEDGKLVPPGRFLYIAERFGVIGELDRWIVSHAIRAMGEHKAHGQRLALAINISGASAGEDAMLATITEELQAADLDPHDLTLEITETAAVADIPRARRFAEALARIGCRVALDDFGAGFGSFYYLKHLPFDALKIDGEFVRHACENPADRLVIKAVTDIARGLGKHTIAEFVPNEQTVQLLVDLGVDWAQGYFLGRPRPLEELLPEPALTG